MIVCATCGTSNRADERFCAECGAFLEWEGTRLDRATEDADPTIMPDQPGPTEPVALQPGQAVPRRPVRRAAEPSPQLVTGEVSCPRCGAGNDRTRRFCRACGAELAVVVVARRSWWRRLLDRLTRGREPSRPPTTRRSNERQPTTRQPTTRRPTGIARRLILITALLCLLTVLAVVGPPLVYRAIDEIRDQTQDHVPLTPTAAIASSAGRNTPATRIADGASNQFWAPTGKAVDSWVEVSFTSPVRILDIVIHSGISTDQEKFLTVGRPDRLEVTATADDGTTVQTTLTLRDQPGEQGFAFEAAATVRIRFIVRSTYGPESTPAVAIGEVEFFGRH